MSTLRAAALFLTFITLTGCHSPYIATTITNHTTQTIDLIEVDYPSASFGTQSLAPGATFHYRFKILGSGNVKLTYTTTTFHNKTSNGPALKEGEEGPLQINIDPDGVHWQYSPPAKHP
jgi:hypothetical protein